MRLEGEHSARKACKVADCMSPSSGVEELYRCNDCFQHGLMCHLCCAHHHAHLPFHRIKVMFRLRRRHISRPHFSISEVEWVFLSRYLT